MSVSRQSHNFVGSAYRDSRRKSTTGAAGWVRPSGSKLAQLNRLIISERSDLPELADGNALVDWNQVRCVDVLIDNVPCCPICLDSVVIPNMLQCGHSFCLPCILIHLSSACSCCVCSEYARPGDLRSVRFQLSSPVAIATTRTFQLVRTSRGVSLPLGSGEGYIPSLQSLGWWFSRVATWTDAETRRFHFGELERLKELPIPDSEDGIHAFASVFAFEFLETRLASLPEPSVASPSNKLADPGRGFVSVPLSDLSCNFSLENFAGDCSYSYQLVDGQHVYLEPVWVRVLLHRFTGDADGWRNVDKLPKKFSLHIIHTTALSVDYELRRRYRSLAHLPLGSAVVLCDVDLRGIVGEETFQALQVPIARRLELIKKVKTQRRNDRRDVKRANAIPLSEEWGLTSGGQISGFSSPERIPSQQDFVPLPGCEAALQLPSSPPTFPDRITAASFAQIAGDLAGSVFTDDHVVARNSSEEDQLLAQFSRRSTADRANEISQALERAQRNPKKKGVKLRIAG